jgi:putative transposase
MKGRRHTPEQIVRKLREADRLLAEGADVAEICRHLEISVPIYQCWRHQFKAMRPEDVVRLKALEKENARLKRLLADKELDIDMLGEVARGNSDPGATSTGGHPSAGPLRGARASGVSVRGSTPVLPAPLLGPWARRGPAPGPAPAPGPPSSPLRLSPYPRPAHPGGLGLQPPAGPTPVA